MVSREATRPFPSRPRNEWVVDERVAARAVNGVYEFEYQVRETSLAQEPFFIVNHKAQLRENHQRVETNGGGGVDLIHVSGARVAPEEIETFLATRVAYHRDLDGRWRNGQGGVLDGFMFPRAPWAGGGEDALDPQWQRETYTLPIADQVSECIKRRLDRAEARQESGDKRGTTLNLQVGASEDDAWEQTAFSSTNLTVSVTVNSSGEQLGLRWDGVTIENAATVDTAVCQIFVSTSDDPDHLLDFQASDDAPSFTTGDNDISGRTYTGNAINWVGSNIGFNDFKTTPSLVTPLQAVIDRGGWVSGNAVVLRMLYDGGSLAWKGYDDDSAKAAKLDIDYTAGGGGGGSAVASILQQGLYTSYGGKVSG